MYESGRSCSHVRAGQARHHPVVVRGWVDRSLGDYWSPRAGADVESCILYGCPEPRRCQNAGHG